MLTDDQLNLLYVYGNSDLARQYAFQSKVLVTHLALLEEYARKELPDPLDWTSADARTQFR